MPNYPINPGMFVGRLEELESLERILLQTRAGQPANFIISGERGIGKTSLLNYIRDVAQGFIPIGEKKLKYLVVETDIDQNTTQMGLIQKIELGIRRELSKTEKIKSFLKQTWSFMQRIEAAGFAIKENNQKREAEIIIEEFAYSLADTIKRVSCPGDDGLIDVQYDGLLILIDEADNCSSLNLGQFFKLLLERVQRQNCFKICVGLAGLPDLTVLLHQSHPSSVRMFEELYLDRLSDNEIASVIEICITAANEKNQTQTTITEKAKSVLIGFSEGYPHFIQQFGFSAFDYDSDNEINEDDVMVSAFGRMGADFGPRGALEIIGDRFYRNNFYNKIQKDNYRQVLRIMAEKLDEWVTKQQIKENFKGSDTTLRNALQALRTRHIILSKEGERGVYRLQHKGFALWIKLYTTERSQDVLKTPH